MSEYFPAKHQLGLFRSDAWLNAWDLAWGDCKVIAPLGSRKSDKQKSIFCYSKKIKKIWSINCAFPAGITTPVARSIRSEYFVFGAAGIKEAYASQYIKNALDSNWDELFIPDVISGSEDWRALQSASTLNGLDFIVIERTSAYGIDLSNHSFEDYLQTVGPNTRLKLFNRRKNLEYLGQVKVFNAWPDKNYFFDWLNVFHEKRWGKPCYEGRNEKFISTLLDSLSSEGHLIDMSMMTLNGQVVSVVLDIGINGRIYNLQSGYLENFAKNISLGTLHLGYQIESAIASRWEFYDLMAGNGKNANYKKSLANETAQLDTILLVRNPLLKLLYKLKFRLGNISNN